MNTSHHMRRLTKIRFSAYKRFAGAEEIELKPVTILVGKNSSGKSSITKLFPLLRNSLLENASKNVLSYTNDGISLGINFGNLAHNGSAVELKLGVEFSDELSIDLDLMSPDGMKVLVYRYALKYIDKEYSLIWEQAKHNYRCVQTGCLYDYDYIGFIHVGLFRELGIDPNVKQSIDYIGPIREIPERTIYTTTDAMDSVGLFGERAYQMFLLDTDLQYRVSQWFYENFEGCSITSKTLSDTGAYQILLHKMDQGEYFVNIADEGMGMGQVFPVVVRCLKAINNSIVVLEQPELHLHPAAHAQLAKLFANTAKDNNHTYVVETHSENILLGIREAIVDKSVKFSADDAVIYFVDEDETGSFLRRITIDEKGVLSDWPIGVFNESYELLRSIREKIVE